MQRCVGEPAGDNNFIRCAGGPCYVRAVQQSEIDVSKATEQSVRQGDAASDRKVPDCPCN